MKKAGKYHGITHGRTAKQVAAHRGCKRGIHLFDEVLSDDAHYLSCDKCGLEVHIAAIAEIRRTQ